MKKIYYVILLISASIILTIVANQFTKEQTEKINILKIWNDKTGESHFGIKEIELNSSGAIGKISSLIPGKGIIFRKTPADYTFSWHVAPRKQFIVNLDASVEITVSDGEKRIINRGEVFFVEDTWGKGHYSKSVNNKERNSLFIPVEE
ncbi:hypothetical protein GF322_04180 [Candidatus Dependentiae bacterium]|nr:hypothetical protein [Candidatus Dependentiae bacterium]